MTLRSVILAAVATVSTGALQYRAVQNVPLDGVFCRGSACQFRKDRVALTLPVMKKRVQAAKAIEKKEAATGKKVEKLVSSIPEAVPVAPQVMAEKEMCRGLGCPDGMGQPFNPKIATFQQKCAKLFNGKLQGEDSFRTVVDVASSFSALCGPKVGNSEACFCNSYTDVFVAALAPELQDSTVGSVESVCEALFTFVEDVKKTEVALGLASAALPANWQKTTGQDTINAENWRKYVAATPSLIGGVLSLQTPPAPVALLSKVGIHNYEVGTGSKDGKIKPLKVPAALFEHCEAEMSEILIDPALISTSVSKRVQDWCNFQSEGSEFMGGGKKSQWTPRLCIGMAKLTAFALRDVPVPANDKVTKDLAKALASKTALPADQLKMFVSPKDVCIGIFSALGAIHRVDGLVAAAFQAATRGDAAAAGPTLPSATDADIVEFVKAATRSA